MKITQSLSIYIMALIVAVLAVTDWSWPVWIAALFLVAAVVLDVVLRRNARRLRGASSGDRQASPFLVTFDDRAITVTCEDRKTESVTWDELIMAGIRIEDGLLPETWWVLGGSNRSGCLFPTAARGSSELLVEMQRRLPGFDNRVLIEVMGSTDKGSVIWERRPVESRST